MCGWAGLFGIVDESKITRETKIKSLNCEIIKRSILQTLQSQRVYGFYFMSFGPQCVDELSRNVLVEKDSHAG